MNKIIFLVSISMAILFSSCDKVDNPYPVQSSLELDTTLYPGNWSDYVANEWPVFTLNTNTNRTILIEDFTGHQCIYCPAAADLALQLHDDNPGRVLIATIHSGPTGIGDFQSVELPNYPTDFTNPQGLEIGTYFGINDGGFSGNPRGMVSRIASGGNIFQSPTTWTNITNTAILANVLKVNIQSKLNYYDATHGAYLHTEVDKLDASLTNDLGIVVYLQEDSLVGDQKMSDNSHNSTYIHRDLMRKCIDGRAFGRKLTDSDMINGKYYFNYSFVVPNQLDGVYNAENMHLLIYVYDKITLEVYQVIRQKIIP